MLDLQVTGTLESTCDEIENSHFQDKAVRIYNVMFSCAVSSPPSLLGDCRWKLALQARIWYKHLRSFELNAIFLYVVLINK